MDSSSIRLVGFLLGLVLPGNLLKALDEPLSVGDSTVVRNRVNLGLHIPPGADGPHGPMGVMIFFGGTGDSIEVYQKALSPMADALDLVVVIPQMPWFQDPGKVPEAGVYQALAHVLDEIEKSFHSDPRWVIINGASAGGAVAHELTRKWASKVSLLILHSTGPFPDISQPRILHVVAEKETNRLNPEGRHGPVLGRGHKDSFAIPGASHGAHFAHMEVWLETEMAVLRLEQASPTIRLAEGKLSRGQADQAAAILRSTVEATGILSKTVPENDALFQYEAKHRQELAVKYAAQIQTVMQMQEKISSPPAAAETPILPVR